MCKPASMIVTRERVLWDINSDSHEDIIRKYKLNDTTYDPDFVRIEIVPPHNCYTIPLNNWIMHIDQNILPDWWNYKEAEIAVHDQLPKWAKYHIFDHDHFVENGQSRIAVGNAIQTINGGKGYAYNNSTQIINGGEGYAYNNSTQIINGGEGVAYDNSTQTINGGKGVAYDNSTQIVNGGEGVAYDNSTQIVNGGEGYAYDNSTQIINGGEGYAYNNSTQTINNKRHM